MSKLALWCFVLGCVACGPSFHLPLAAVDIANARDPRALVAYLSQPNADPAVCDARARGPHVAADPALGHALVEALRSGQAAPPIWRACVDGVLASADHGTRSLLVDDILRGYAQELEQPGLERYPVIQARLDALAAAYRDRPPELAAQRASDEVRTQLRARLANPALGPRARRSASELIAVLEVERGTWDSQVVDLAMLDAEQAAGREAQLALFAARLPDAALRAQATRRVIRLRIAASPFAEVRDDAAHVEAVVLELGKNPVSPQVWTPTRAALDPAKLTLHGVVVRQDVAHQTAQVSGLGASLIGPIALRGALSVELAGLSRPVTLCGAARDLDPTPCLAPADVVVDSPLIWRDAEGGVHLRERLTAPQVVELARGGLQLSLPIAIAGQPLTALESTLAFTAPEAVVYAGSGSGPGPTLHVDIEQRDGRVFYAIDDGHGVRRAVVEQAAVRELQIVSRGGAGSSGSDGSTGSDGSPGTSGTSAGCGSRAGDGGRGGDGSRGSDGEDGGRGGNGGDIQVRVRCDDCSALLDVLPLAIRSAGGAGGSAGRGGRGGHGGRGGSGGAGTTCSDAAGTTTTEPAGSTGSSGSDGFSGSDGSRGPDGTPGHVTIERLAPR